MRLVLALAAILPLPALANDSTAELSTGGLVLARSDAVEMIAERLSISEKQIAVDYVFHNISDADVDSLVAFPMPDIEGGYDLNIAIPEGGPDNPFGFRATQDGKALTPTLEARAVAMGLDVTDELKAAGVPILPTLDAASVALNKLPQATQADWLARGIVQTSTFDAGQGWQTESVPMWTARMAYWWRTTFPAGKDVKVAHRYLPSVGGSAGISFLDTDGTLFDPDGEMTRKYCLDKDFLASVARANKGPNGLSETRLSYVLGTGGNWAGGTIRDFTLIVDKGSPDSLVSFCGQGVKKTGPTTFEMHATDYEPPEFVDVLIVRPYPVQ